MVDGIFVRQDPNVLETEEKKGAMSDLETNKYVRKQFEVTGVQVTPENMAKVAEWCGGEIQKTKESVEFVKVPVTAGNPKFARTYRSRAFPTDWILVTGKSYKVYTNAAFKASFDISS